MPNLPIVSIVLGTRPEAIKLAPVIKAFRSCSSINTRVVLTGQHKEMVYPVMDLFEIEADQDLGLMLPTQSLTHVTCSVLQGLRTEFQSHPSKLVLVQGDTTTALASALAAFYEKIPVGHIEAGLRTENLLEPFPEEANRRLISQIATLNFAPTKLAAANLKVSGVIGEILVTGNTVVDAIHSIEDKAVLPHLPLIDWDAKRVILVTVHRRENWGQPLMEIAKGLNLLLDSYPEAVIILPMHRNPVVRKALKKYLGGNPRIVLTNPLDYGELVAVMKRSCLLLTDSGGLQEEAPAFGKPVLVLRNTTERREALEAGTAILVGTDPQKISSEAIRLLEDKEAYKTMASVHNPFGDGKASGRILRRTLELLAL
ncbi:non-hydrolyzing UDP-N-acetylglucosamine 2-epimerase [Prochlorococcus sp. MIT 1341]|uniref:non-hydrolyzing UDP-N-acetylglucosamine 2-epimerase n=1 Tax=Prochlorococcus sp. MIT 1341 TaxID=3096221 RepID=UPI002A74CC10|nr:UDP-N-acetylglucosamine 2-epimerase (non-hydrolyzing) [Prochlorococcus sp. MIT 1341]